jgi:hypothetical protein
MSYAQHAFFSAFSTIYARTELTSRRVCRREGPSRDLSVAVAKFDKAAVVVEP